MFNEFELFMGCLGNGTTVCNKAVLENGDYKKIAHISNAGMIHFYVEESYIPEESLEKIKKTAADIRRKFMDYWNSLPALKRYEILLDHANIGDLIKISKDERKSYAKIHYAEELLMRQENAQGYFYY